MSKDLIYRNDLTSADEWLAETNGDFSVGDGSLRWDCEGASRMGTIWCTQHFAGPIVVEYDVECLAGSNNMNLLLCADIPGGDLLASTAERTGAYPEYQQFPNYITTYLTDPEGRTRVRFRRDPGFELISETYCEAPIEQGQVMTIQSVIDADGTMLLRRDGEELHRCQLPMPVHPGGYVGLRTWNTSLIYHRFEVRA